MHLIFSIMMRYFLRFTTNVDKLIRVGVLIPSPQRT
ncbi:hypothetical protein EVA_06134 [gut metagenome]|uniref:Uncharacterized protein n=1 Tax=gut metagenome TaxID=749906 RepID=J9GFM6_9ZZZZ